MVKVMTETALMSDVEPNVDDYFNLMPRAGLNFQEWPQNVLLTHSLNPYIVHY
jgi:hypothetical protein